MKEFSFKKKEKIPFTQEEKEFEKYYNIMVENNLEISDLCKGEKINFKNFLI
mgnify:CR=1 FL=1